MTLDDIRRLNIRDAGNWPLLPKIVILGLLFLLILLAGLQTISEELHEAARIETAVAIAAPLSERQHGCVGRHGKRVGACPKCSARLCRPG